MKTSAHIFAVSALFLLPALAQAQDVPAAVTSPASSPGAASSPSVQHLDAKLADDGKQAAAMAEQQPLGDEQNTDAQTQSHTGDDQTGAAPQAIAPLSDRPEASATRTEQNELQQSLQKLDRTSRAIVRYSALGLQIGEASGLNLAYDIDRSQQLSGLIGFSPLYRSVITQLDYLYTLYSWIPDGNYGVALSVFAGGGLRLGFFEPRPPYLRELPFAVGAHAPFGLVARMPPLPMELVLSAAPGLDISPVLRFHGDASLAIRFYLDPTRTK